MASILDNQILALKNQISVKRTELEGMMYQLRAMEMRRDTELRVIEVVAGPYKGPRDPAPEWVTCRSCTRKTRHRHTTANGLKVARCEFCALEDIALETLQGASPCSGAERNVEGNDHGAH